MRKGVEKIMTMKQKELYNVIERLPDNLLTKAMDYIEYLKFSELTNQIPEEITVKDENDLIEKLEKGVKATENGEVCSVDEAFDKIEKILVS